LDLAVPELHDALRLARALRNSRYEATVQQFLGMAQLELGRLDEAGAALDLSLEIARGNRDRYVEALSLLTVARVQSARSEPAARATAALACDISRRYNMSHHLALALSVLGGIELAQRRFPAAIASLEESERIWRNPRLGIVPPGGAGRPRPCPAAGRRGRRRRRRQSVQPIQSRTPRPMIHSRSSSVNSRRTSS
jgi:tetratricopeptide (TPR) repeat protein